MATMTQATATQVVTKEPKSKATKTANIAKDGQIVAVSKGSAKELAIFNKVLSSISKSSDTLANEIHIAGLYALKMVNESGQSGPASRLVTALGEKHDMNRVVKWLCHFGKLQWAKGQIVYKKRKDITEATADGFMERATETPYWKLTAQTKPSHTFDYLTMIKGILRQHKKANQLEGEGKIVSEKNVHFLKQLETIIGADEVASIH